MLKEGQKLVVSAAFSLMKNLHVLGGEVPRSSTHPHYYLYDYLTFAEIDTIPFFI